MDEKTFDSLQRKSGLEHRYQLIILFTATCFQVFTYMITVSLPFLELNNPILIYDDNLNKIIEIPFDYDHCNMTQGDPLKNKTEYLIKKVLNSSWVNEYDIQCEKAETGLIGSFSFMGLLTGSLIYSFIADKKGRRITILIGSSLCISVLFLFNFSHSLFMIYGLVFLLQTFAMFVLLGNFNYMAEISSTESRAIYGAIINSGDAFSAISFALLFKYLDSWRLIFNICSLLYLIFTIFYYFFTVESPQFHFAKGNTKEVLESLQYIAKINNRTFDYVISDEEAKNLINENSSNNSIISNFNNKQENLIEKYSVLSLIKYPSVRYNFLIMNLIWFTSNGMLFTILISLKTLSGDIYVNAIFFGIVDIFSCVCIGWIIETKLFGRKRTMILFNSICVIFGVLYYIYRHDVTYLITVISMIFYFCATGIFTTCFVYSSEVYPTPLSAKGLSINNLFGYMSSIIFPFLLEYVRNKVFIIFTGLCFISAILLFFVTETYGKTVELDVEEEIKSVLNEDLKMN